MTYSDQEAEEAERLLAAQLSDLVRYRQILEAQRAVLRMEDAGMLDAFSREADGIVADISARDVRLLAIRAAVAPEAPKERPNHRELRERVEQERRLAGAAAHQVVREMEAEATLVAKAIAETSKELQGVLAGYSPKGDSPAGAPYFERKG